MLRPIFNAVLDRLSPLEEQGLKVMPFRGKLVQPTHRGNLTVGFRRSSSQEPQQMNFDAPVIQPRRLEFELLLRLLNLQGHEDSFDAVGEIERLLIGFRPLPEDIHCKRLYHVSSTFISVEESIWGYSLIFALNYPFSQTRSY